MNTDELENRLRKLEPRRPSDGFAERVLAQRPGGGDRTYTTDGTDRAVVAWWRRRVSVPVPAMAAILILFAGIQLAQWWMKPAPASVPRPSSPVVSPQPNRVLADAGSYTVAMSGDCTFQLK